MFWNLTLQQKPLPAHFAHACLPPLSSIKPPCRILNSTAAAAAFCCDLSLTHMSRGSTGFPAATYLQEHPYSSRSRGQRPVAQRSFRAKFSSEGKLSKTEWSQVKRRPRQSARRGGRQDGEEEEQTSTTPPFLQLDSLHLAGGEQTDVIIDNPVGRAQRSTQGWKWFRRQLSTCQMSPQCCSALSVSENFTACEGVDINNIRKRQQVGRRGSSRPTVGQDTAAVFKMKFKIGRFNEWTHTYLLNSCSKRDQSSDIHEEPLIHFYQWSYYWVSVNN